MNTFAGFWRDGAAVEPEDRHTDGDRGVLVRLKNSNRFERFAVRGGAWKEVYWLDTTTPNELTPQEAFEICKLLHPTLNSIQKEGERYFGLNIDERGASINWGYTTEYPPRERWRVPTDADKWKRCRCKRTLSGDWMDRKFICCFNNRFVVWCENSQACEQFDICEVLE